MSQSKFIAPQTPSTPMCTISLEDTEGGCEDVDWHRAWDPKRELNLNLNPNVNLLVSSYNMPQHLVLMRHNYQ